jgi:ABC-type transport system substrate-binding protein
VNYAIDRSAQVVAGQAGVTNQHLPFTMPGFRDVSIYPRHPNLARARSLARGNRRGGKANLYVPDLPHIVVQARLLKRDLARIGLDVRIRAIPFAGFSARISRPREPVDIVRSGWTTDYIDPGAVLVPLFDGRFAGVTNYSWLNDPDVNRALRKASTLQGAARYRAFGELDVRLARDDAPAIAVAYGNQATFVSARTGCVIVKPLLDLTAVCLK